MGSSGSVAAASAVLAAALAATERGYAPGGAASATGAGALPSAIIAAVGSRAEADAVAALERAAPDDLAALPPEEVERLVRIGWWKAAQAAVTRSHVARLDFTAPVRRAVGELKREADLLLKWLDPRFANPETVPMALRWAQNTTAVMLAARFAPRWDAPGANLAVFSTERGRGHVDKQRTQEKIGNMLRVNITGSRLEAEITAEAGNARKRYLLALDLFDEVVPELSSWSLEFRRAQGSMQMSAGAQIPELALLLRKRRTGARRWPRPTAAAPPAGALPAPPAPASGGAATAAVGGAPQDVGPGWWADAPGVSERDAAALRGAPPLVETPLTCSAAGALYCGSAETCVPECLGHCPGATAVHSGGLRCVGQPAAAEVQRLAFADQDLEAGHVSGVLDWAAIPEAFADSFVLRWGSSEDTPLADGDPGPLAVVPAGLDPAFDVAGGTAVPAGASHILVFAANEVGQALVAAAALEDRVRPPPPASATFGEDTDHRPGLLAGTVEVGPSADESHVEGYEVRFGRAGEPPQEVGDGLSPVASVKATRNGKTLLLWLPEGGVAIPKGASLLLVFAVGRGGVQSLPTAAPFADAAPPTAAPARLEVGPDNDPRAGFLLVPITVHPASCDSVRKSKAAPCDLGTSYGIYWAAGNGSRIEPRIHELPAAEAPLPTGPVIPGSALQPPPGAVALMAVARNKYGEMNEGAAARFVDDRSEDINAWRGHVAIAACADGSTVFWRPLVAEQEPSKIDAPALGLRSAATAVAVARGGGQVLLGLEDGSVSLLASSEGQWQVLRTVAGPGAVTALAFDAARMQMLRGSRNGALEVWRMSDGTCTAHLHGHTGAVRAIDVDWAGRRAASLAEDGVVRLWDLETGEPLPALAGSAAAAFAVDWAAQHVLAALQDETLRLLDATSGAELWAVDGHAEPARHVQADFAAQRALSAAGDGTVKAWDMRARECTASFRLPGQSPVASLLAAWAPSQALLLLADGSVALWDLRKGEVLAEGRSHPCTVRAASLV